MIEFALEHLPPFSSLESEWQELDRQGSHSFFLTWTWIGTWLRMLPKSVPVGLIRARDNGETVGLALAVPRRSKLGGVFRTNQLWLNATGDSAFDCLTIEHNGFATGLPQDDALWDGLFRWFVDDNKLADELVLCGIAANAPDGDGLGLLSTERRTPAYRTPLAQLSAEEGIQAVLSRNTRQQLRRSIRAYEAIGPLSVEPAQGEGAAFAFFDGLKEFHIRSWHRRGQKHAFSEPFFEVFHRALISEGSKEGTVELLRISAGSHTLGYLYNFARGKTVFNYQSGFDDSVSRMRPGYVSHALAISHYATLGMSHYDLLAQTNRLKMSFGTDRYFLSWRHVRRPTGIFRTEAMIRNAIRLLQGGAGTNKSAIMSTCRQAPVQRSE